MPSRISHRDDPLFRDIDRWNDGVEDADPNEFQPGATRPPYFPPPQEWPKSTKTAKYIPQSLPDRREEPHERTRPRPVMPEPSRPRHARYRSPSPRPSRDHHHHHHHHHHHRPHDGPSRRETTDGSHSRRPPLASSKTTPAPSSTTTTSRHHRGRSVSPSRHGNPRSDPKARPSVQRSKTTTINYNELLNHPRFQKAAVAALEAGSATAFKLRRAPGSWSGDKAARVAGAAIGAAALGAFKGNPAPKEEAAAGRASEKPRSGGGGGRGGPPSSANVGSALGGMLADQLASRRGGSSRQKGRR